MDKMENRQNKLEEYNKNNEINIAKLSTKATIYGTIAGLVTSAILSLIVGVSLFYITGSSSNKNINIKEGRSIEKKDTVDSRRSDHVEKNK
jgi:lipid II:glycine glycyltransferase (peptidoglycan interpeptide bridge formation enzyme)